MGSVGARGGGSGGEVSLGVDTTESREEDLFKTAQTVDEALKRQLQIEMGQTGDEAGRADLPRGDGRLLYVKTSKSFNINAYLNSDGETIHSEHSTWDMTGRYGREDVINAINQIDAGMKPLSRDIQVARFVDRDALEKMFGMSLSSSGFRTLLSRLESGDDTFGSNFKTMLQGVDYTHKGYSSTTYTGDHASYGSKDIKLNIVMRKGTSAIVTNNDLEHEILGAHGLKYNFTGGYRVQTVTDEYGTRKKQLVLDVVL